MKMINCLSLLLLAALSVVHAVPFRRAVTPVSAADLAGFAPFTQFARAAYCSTKKLHDWKCGNACNAVPDFHPTLIGGDGNSVQIYFVGYWKTQNTIVVAHQGTDPTKFLAVLTDIKILQKQLDPKLFPGVPSNVKVHSGFSTAHASTATKILAEVKSLMASRNTTSVTVVGHSLGGALAALDSLYLTLNLPATTSIQAVTYGQPRVGNSAFAQLVSAKVPNFRRVVNRRDPVPIVPDRGYLHNPGEIHLLRAGVAFSCPGYEDTTDPQCINKYVPNLAFGNVFDHLGPYEGIRIGTIYCT